ncbi:MAG: cytochrome c [Burkholderiaceae bacterium]|nr:cytochrome c [Burkholderiaceae bacterium]
MKKLAISLVGAAVAAGALYAIPAAAQFAKVEDAIKYRKASFTVMANHVGRLSAMAKGERPFDAAAAQNSAKIIDLASHLPWEAMVPNSASGDTRLKPEALANAAEFKQLGDKLKAETAKLVTASASLDTLKAQMGPTGGACKGCHDKFRKD